MVTNLRAIAEAPTASFDLRQANLGPQASPVALYPAQPQQGDVADAAVSRFLRVDTGQRVSPNGGLGPRMPQIPIETGSDRRGFDLPDFLQKQQDVVADLLEEQLERAIELLIACRLAGGSGTLADKRRVLFDLYDEGVVSKSQVRERGRLEPAEFHEEIRAYRTRSRQR